MGAKAGGGAKRGRGGRPKRDGSMGPGGSGGGDGDGENDGGDDGAEASVGGGASSLHGGSGGIGGSLNRDTSAALVSACATCADCFAGLMLLVQEHAHRSAVLACSLGLAGRYLDLLLKALPWWRLAWGRHAGPLLAMVRELQRGTRVVHSFCAEGKARR